MEIQVGDTIRSYDFPHLKTEYFEGVVTKFDGFLIHCDTTKIVRKGVEWDIDYAEQGLAQFTTLPMGECMLDEKFPGRLEILEEASCQQ